MATRPNDPQSGFTLIESLVAMALMGLLISTLLAITSQWLPNWDRGLRRIQRSESLSVALDRISADIAAAEFIRPDGQSKSVLFDGSDTSITLARNSLGPNRSRGLDVVRIAEAADRDGVALTRTRAAFAPGDASSRNLADPVVLLQAPYRVTFAYAGADRTWQQSWQTAERLPTAVRVTIRDATSGSAMSVSRIVMIHVSAPAESICSSANNPCDRQALLSNATTSHDSARSEQ